MYNELKGRTGMFQRILIANRGEIAVRIIKTAQKLGIRVVAIYHPVDEASLFVGMADEAYQLPESDPQKAYLDGAAIIKIAKKNGVEAIHPGYGFLSENAEFATLCEAAKIVFIGPSAQNIVEMGEKGRARQLMQEAGLPVLNGYDGDDQSEAIFVKKAKEIGYPVLLKATAGGGGKGMRVVSDQSEMAEALRLVKRESMKLFKNDQMIMEKYLKTPRHIEIQVFCDHHGNGVYLFERECSIQRRHQKIIEEAPALISQDLRQKMGEQSVKAALSIGYRGAGTFEYLLDEDGQFYFMEMNTRLQVEHPVTEAITGVDLVEWQLRVAAGDKLPLGQKDLKIKGHAIELRLCAEDVRQQFLPSIGVLDHLVWPKELQSLRIETGVSQGDTISPYFDPMIAKVVFWHETRSQAVAGLAKSLSEVRLLGLKTNLEFLAAILRDSDYQKGLYSTGYIPSHYEGLIAEMDAEKDLSFCALALYLSNQKEAQSKDLWSEVGLFRLNHVARQAFFFNCHGVQYKIGVEAKGDLYDIQIEDRLFTSLKLQQGEGNRYSISGLKELYFFSLIKNEDCFHIYMNERHFEVVFVDPLEKKGNLDEVADHLMAPMPGKVIELFVSDGATVKKGASLIVIEAMKMEHTLIAPQDGVVKECFYRVGDQVTEGAALFDFEAA